MLQAFLHNPRPEPYLLGVSGGAAVGAVVAFALGAIGEAAITLAAFGGSVIAGFVTPSVGRTGGRASRGGPRTPGLGRVNARPRVKPRGPWRLASPETEPP